MLDELANDAESELENKGPDNPYSTYQRPLLPEPAT
jgi:hypothetical protein